MNQRTITQKPVDIKLPANGQVTLTILIGFAQMGSSLVKFDGAPDVLAKGTVTDLPLGDVAGLIGKTLLITSKVLDSNTATPHYIITHDFGIGKPKHFVESGSFQSDGELLTWNTTYNFI